MINQRNRSVSFGQAVKDYFKGAFDYKGFSTREGYWKAFAGEILITVTTGMTFTILPFEVWLLLVILVGLSTTVCSLFSGIRRMRDICMSTRGIWTYYGIALMTSLMFAQNGSTSMIRIGIGIASLILALLPTNALLKYKDTSLGKWFVDPSLENIIDM